MADEPKQYLIERIHRALATDPRVNALHLEVTLAGGRVFVTGEVSTHERRTAVSTVVAELLPDHEVSNETTVASLEPATEVEDIT